MPEIIESKKHKGIRQKMVVMQDDKTEGITRLISAFLHSAITNGASETRPVAIPIPDKISASRFKPSNLGNRPQNACRD